MNFSELAFAVGGGKYFLLTENGYYEAQAGQGMKGVYPLAIGEAPRIGTMAQEISIAHFGTEKETETVLAFIRDITSLAFFNQSPAVIAKQCGISKDKASWLLQSLTQVDLMRDIYKLELAA